MRECEESSRCVHSRKASHLARDWKVAKCGTRVKYAKELKAHDS